MSRQQHRQTVFQQLLETHAIPGNKGLRDGWYEGTWGLMVITDIIDIYELVTFTSLPLGFIKITLSLSCEAIPD